MIKVFIAGGTGMLGLSLANFLKRKGLEVIVQGYKHKADINLDLNPVLRNLRSFGYCKSGFHN